MTVDISESRERLLEFLQNNTVGVLATISSAGKPHAATVYVTYDRDLNIYFVTRKGTQKSQNIQDNHLAALAIYDAAAQTTLQAEGTVVQVSDPAKIQWVFNDIWLIAAQTSPSSPPPQTQLIHSGEYTAYKLATPTLRLATFRQQSSANPETIFSVIPTQDQQHFNSHQRHDS